jgi:hypothetical protein
MNSTKALDAFKNLTFGHDFGFDAFESADLDLFLQERSIWSLGFKKQTGRGILYGKAHAKLRRQLVNDRPQTERVAMLKAKCDFFKVFDKIAVVYPSIGGYVVEDIEDIGMGHSVYLVSLRVEDGTCIQVVVKQEDREAQPFFSAILRMLGWPHYRSGYVWDEYGGWELSEYLGSDTVYDVLIRNRPLTQAKICLDSIETQLARHSALGDVLGRGDRHFENYLVRQGCVYPIDVSLLFWEGNEEWVWKYIAGGMSEYAILSLCGTQSEFERKKASFWQTYSDTLKMLCTKRADLEAEIIRWFSSDDLDTARKLAFIGRRLDDVDGYVASQQALYDRGFSEMMRRRHFKHSLSSHVDTTPQILETDALLKMYYLADQDRLSTFFLLEDRPVAFRAVLEGLTKTTT